MKKKLIGILLLASLIPLVLVSLGSYYFYSNNLKSNYNHLSMTNTNITEVRTDSFINLHMNALKLVALNSNIATYNSELVKPLLDQVVKAYPAMDPVSLDNTSGKQVIKSGNSALVDVTDRVFYQEAMKGKEEVISEVLVSKMNNHPIIVLATPIKQNDKIVGVLQGTLDLGVMQNFVKEHSKEGYTTFILDKEGKLLAHPNDQLALERKDYKEFDFVNTGLKGNDGTVEITENGDRKIVTYVYDEKTGWLICTEQPYSMLTAQMNKLLLTTSIIVFLTAILSVIFGLIMTGRILKPISAIVKVTEVVASGNLNVSVETKTNDEVGVLSRNFNIMLEHLRVLIENIARSSDHIASATKQFLSGTEEVTAASNEITTLITSVAHGAESQVQAIGSAVNSVEQISARIDQIAINSQEIVKEAQNSSAVAGQGSIAVEQAIDRMNLIEKTVLESAQLIHKLGERSAEIGQIVDAISSIAQQTNLLALNAAIEAARAGEQGRGFAVVAEEVKKLADQSQESAKKIADLISGVRLETEQAVNAMNEGTIQVKRGTEAVSEVSNSLNQIIFATEQVSTKVTEIAYGIDAIANNSRAMVSSINQVENISRNFAEQTQGISASTEEQVASMEEITASSHDLERMAQELQQVIAKFRVS